MPLSGRKSAAFSYAAVSIRAPAWLAAPREMVSVMASPLLCGVGRRRSGPGAGRFSGLECYAGRATLACMDDLLERLQQAIVGLQATRGTVEGGAPWPLAAVFDTSEEASWGPPEVLSHLAEMAPFWLGEIERVLAGD